MSQKEKSNLSYLLLLFILVTCSIILIVKMRFWETDNGDNGKDQPWMNEGSTVKVHRLTTMKETTIICKYTSKKGDDKCHDDANKPECGYDGGDCCKTKIDDSECEICYCHIDSRRKPSSLEVDGKLSARLERKPRAQALSARLERTP